MDERFVLSIRRFFHPPSTVADITAMGEAAYADSLEAATNSYGTPRHCLQS